MEIEVKKDTNNAVVGRREIEFWLMQDDKTPAKEDVKKELCKKLNLHPDATIIVKIDQSYGVKRASGLAHSYKDAEAMKKNEHEYLFEREVAKAKRKEKAEGAAPKEEKKE